MTSDTTFRPAVATAQEIVDAAKSPLHIPDGEFQHLLHLSSPRVRFLKAQPYGSHILDLGAGDGNMELFRRWLQPERSDLKLYATSLEVGSNFHAYEGYEVANFNDTKPDFGGRIFDAIITNHFVEHIDGGLDVMCPWAASRLRMGGRMYVEFPSDLSKASPSLKEVKELGLDVSCLNFYDDSTHEDTVGLDVLRPVLERNGFFIEESGYWRNPFLEDELIARGAAAGDKYLATVGAWMKTYFCQYAVAYKIA